jgi:probable phosphoglycerate mutase
MTDTRTTILYAVRHGETEWNLIGKQQGHLNSPLTATGIKQAHALAAGLSDKGIEIIYSSDLGRAFQTAEVIAAKLTLPVNVDSRLRERHLGTMQGLTKAQFREQFPHESAAFDSGDPDYILPDGESARQRYERCLACSSDLVSRHLGRTLLIVAHGGLLNSLFHHTLKIPLTDPRRFSLFNAAINRFSVTNHSWRLDSWGNTSHLHDINTLDDN